MSHALISHSDDLKRLQEAGYEIAIVAGFLVVDAIPYLRSTGDIAYGKLVTDLDLAGERTARPSNHVIHFVGEHPCKKDGSRMESIANASKTKQMADGLTVNHSFSNKPSSGYANYFEKVDRYAEMISAPVRSIDPSITPKTHRLAGQDAEDSVFEYTDTNSTRAEIRAISERMNGQRIAIVGLGGTGSYVLDFVSKCPVAEIHPFDKDQFLNHNAFRAPSAASIDLLRTAPKKVEYFGGIYSNMHKGVRPHPYHIDESNVHELCGFDFVFICVDKGSVKGFIIEALEEAGVSYVDVGMGVYTANEQLLGLLRVTAGTPENRGEAISKNRINFSDAYEDDDYDTNIQIAELNAYCAVMAVIEWKKTIGVYQDLAQERHSVYTLNVDMLTHDEDID